MFDNATCNKMGSIWAIAQGILAFVAPGTSVSFLKRMLEMNFENADQLEARDSYLRQIRALGVGLAAAGIAGYVIEAVEAGGDGDEGVEDADDSLVSS